MKKVLIAEDDQFLTNAYKLRLSKLGYEVTIVTDGDEAIAMLNKQLPDIIILDIIMPLRDGLSTLEEIKKNPKWKQIPVVIASNLGQKEDIQKGIALGAKDYFIKSDLSLADLAQKMNKILGV